VVAIVTGTLAALAGAVAGPGWLRLGALVPAAYVVAVVVGSQAIAGGADRRERAWLPVVVATMHMTWGAGFLVPLRRLGRHSPAVRRFKAKVRA
jgi:hypothetical protein